MNIKLFADPFELKDALKVYTDTRFSDEIFGLNANNATGEILGKLRPNHRAEMLFLDYYTDSVLQGTATAGAKNELTLSGAGWTASEFAWNIPVEVLIWNDSAFYVADVTANTADTLTISGVGHADITVAKDDKFYLRLKNPQLNSYAKALGLYLFIGYNRQARGTEELSTFLQDNEQRARDELDKVIEGQRDLMFLKNTELITLNGDNWQYLERKSIIPDTEIATVNGTEYRPEQGFEVDYSRGAIKYVEPDCSTALSGNSSISITYYYGFRKMVF